MSERLTDPPTSSRTADRPADRRGLRLDPGPAPALPARGPLGPALGQLMRPEGPAARPPLALPDSTYAGGGKRLFDLAVLAAVAPLALALSLPIALVNLALFRRLNEVLFTQDRVGHRGATFRIYKFRTMRASARGSYDSWQSGGDQLRVTGFGRFLRNSHLDELPQLINVLRGEMSLIGPRPEMVEIEAWADATVPGFTERLVARPGITGFAQVQQGYTGRCEEAYREKLDLSTEYVRRLSLRLDLWIVWRTAVTMLKLDGWRWHDKLTGTRGERDARRRRTPNPLWN